VKNSLFSKIFSSGLQAIAVQVLGGIFFILILLFLSKEESGAITWANSVALVIVMALSFGMDQVVVRRIAASDRSDWAAPAYFFHLLILNGITLILLTAIVLIGGTKLMTGFRLLPWMFLVQGVLYTAGPLKFFFNAKQQFKPYAIIAITSNIAKIGAGIWLLKTTSFTAWNAMLVLIACALFELTALLLYILLTKQFSFKVRWVAYTKLVKEAMPQYIAVLFDSSLARADMILLGILCTNVITSEYGLAYRAYEIAKLPLTVISPILLARLARQLATNTAANDTTTANIRHLVAVEGYFSMLIPLVLNLLWAPLLDGLFDKKFGTVNATEFMLLSICIPIHFYINILWTLAFSARKYKKISTIIGITAIANIILNLALIPFLSATGAAIAFLITCIAQLAGYHKLVKRHIAHIPVYSFFTLLFTAMISYYATTYLLSAIWLQVIVSVIIYTALCLMTKQVSLHNIKGVIVFFKAK
jgi:O-antigen/teichoic acid export membrane protein